MKKMMAMLLVLVLAASMAACQANTKTVYVQTQSLRTIGAVEIRMDYTYSDDGTPVSVMTYFNDQLYQTSNVRTSGGLQYLTITDADGNSSTQAMEYIYDDDGKLIRDTTIVGGSEVGYTNYTYDDNGNVVKTVSAASDVVTNTTYTYDASGNLIQQLQEIPADGSYLRREFVYNGDNYVIRENTYSAEDVLDGYVEIAYADGDTEKTMTYFDAEGKPTGEVVVETYDEHGNKVQEITTMDGEEVMRTVNTYVAMEVPVKGE